MAKRKNGIYRAVQISFWEDAKVVDDYTPEDKYFYLYLFTNPHTNLCGCYEISKTHMSRETGYNTETISRLLERFETVHKVICYDNETKELLLINWHKYNWTNSDSLRTGLSREIDKIKTQRFKEYLTSIFDGGETVPIPSIYRGETVPIPCGDGGGITVTVSDTVTDTDTVSVADSEKDIVYSKPAREEKQNECQTVVDMFNSTCKSLPQVRSLTDNRKRTLNARLKKYSLAEFQLLFDKAESSKFLCGSDGKWQASFDWLLNENNMAKVLEGNYDNRKSKETIEREQYIEMLNEWANGNKEMEEQNGG